MFFLFGVLMNIEMDLQFHRLTKSAILNQKFCTTNCALVTLLRRILTTETDSRTAIWRPSELNSSWTKETLKFPSDSS